MRPLQNVRVLLTDGFTRQVLPMARALRRSGCHVAVLCGSRLDLGYASRWPNERLLGIPARTDAAGFLRDLQLHLQSKRYDVLIPLTDCSADIVARHKHELSALTTVAVNDLPVFECARDKLLTMKKCMERGIPCPRTIADLRSPEDVLESGLQFPVVLKPRTGDSAVGFARVQSLEELRALLRRTEDRFGPALVQEYIPQDDLQYKAELFLDRNGVLTAAVVFAKIRWYPVDGGSSTLNATVERPDIVTACESLLRAMHWVGYADVDLIQDPRDHVCKVMEINPRVTGSVKLAFDAGVNFASMIVQEALGQTVEPQLAYQTGRYLRYFHKDLLWLLQSPERFSSRPSWFDFRRTTDQVLSFDDPLPGLVLSLQSLAMWAADRKRREG
jgi:predicted ATP-grasp superfamily ATP-dependent carboligase